jgi:hypothetical protein
MLGSLGVGQFLKNIDCAALCQICFILGLNYVSHRDLAISSVGEQKGGVCCKVSVLQNVWINHDALIKRLIITTFIVVINVVYLLRSELNVFTTIFPGD